MFYIAHAEIAGDEALVAKVKETFGAVEYRGERQNPEPTLALVRVLPNYYKDCTGKNPLYLLVPDMLIENVWPGMGFDEVKYGVAHSGNAAITNAVAVFKGQEGIYFCLTPKGEDITEIGNLGI